MVLIAHYLQRSTLIGSGALSQIVQKVVDDLSVNLTIIDNIDNSQLPTLLHYDFYLTCSRFVLSKICT